MCLKYVSSMLLLAKHVWVGGQCVDGKPLLQARSGALSMEVGGKCLSPACLHPSTTLKSSEQSIAVTLILTGART